MCGIIGILSNTAVNQVLYDGLLLLQHRGQDAAGIATSHNRTFNIRKGRGLVRDVFRTRDMRALLGPTGLGHVRYPTAGSAFNSEEAQPFYVNAPFGITLVHNGNLTNSKQLKDEMFRRDRRHINTQSDSEVILNVLANELQELAGGTTLEVDTIFSAVSNLHLRVRGAYSCIAEIAGHGILAFRDPFGIRPLFYGQKESQEGMEYLIASESVAIDGLGFQRVRDILPGEAIFITYDGQFIAKQCVASPILSPCIFEYIYFARPDSLIEGVSVYAARLKMGEYLADSLSQQPWANDVEVVIPIPDTARPSAMQLAMKLGLKYREGFLKNRYIGRTFIMPGQETRRKSVRQKLNAMPTEFQGKNVLIVDDSIVRGTTSGEIIQMARDSGARKVYFASAAPPIRYPNVYGIDMPTKMELIAHGRSLEQIQKELGADGLVYQSLESVKKSIRDINPSLENFEAACFDGVYVTHDITPEYLKSLVTPPTIEFPRIVRKSLAQIKR